LTFNQKQKQSFLPNAKDQVRKFSKLTAAAQPCQVKPVLIHEQRSFHTQFQGNKMRNRVLYPTPLITLEMSNKEGAVVDIVFCLALICMLDPKNSKNIIFSPWGHGNI